MESNCDVNFKVLNVVFFTRRVAPPMVVLFGVLFQIQRARD